MSGRKLEGEFLTKENVCPAAVNRLRCVPAVQIAAERTNETVKHIVCKVVTVMFVLSLISGLSGCGGSGEYTADDIVLINTVYYGTERNPVYSFALKKGEDCWLFSADCLVGNQKEHYTSFSSFPVTAKEAQRLLGIIREDGEIERLRRHRNPLRLFHVSDAPSRCCGITFSDGNTMEKEATLGDRTLQYLHELADRYYEAAERSTDTPTDIKMR